MVWWYTTIILALKRLRQENCEFEVSLDYVVNMIHLSQNRRKQNNKKEAKIKNKMKEKTKPGSIAQWYVFAEHAQC